MKVSLLSRFGGLSLGLTGLIASGVVRAADYGLGEAARSAGIPTSNPDLTVTIGRMLAFVLGFTGTIFFILILYAGFMWMTAGGNQENIGKAQSILKNAIIGLVIVLSAYAITRFIGGAL